MVGRLRRSVVVEAVSTAWESPAVDSDGPDYINAAVLVRTPMPLAVLKAPAQGYRGGNGSQPAAGRRLTIDIDIVVFDTDILEIDLWSQAYRAVTVGELLPDLCCPATGESLSRRLPSSPERWRSDRTLIVSPGPPESEMPRTLPTDSTRTPTLMTDLPVSSATHSALAGGPAAFRAYKYFDLLMAAFVTILICSEFIAASKGRSNRDRTSSAQGVVFFPLSYIFGEILTEVYGYARSRKVIWTGFVATHVRDLHELGSPLSSPGRACLAAPESMGDGLFQLMADRGGITVLRF